MLKLVFEFLVQLWVKVFKYKLCFSYDPLIETDVVYRKGKHGKYYYTFNNSKRVYNNGYLHSLTEPSVKSYNSEIWYFEGKLHRETGPAVSLSTFSTYYKWYKHGKRHRLDGPAVFHVYAGWHMPGGYWIDGVQYIKKEDFWNHPKVIEHKLNKIENL